MWESSEGDTKILYAIYVINVTQKISGTLFILALFIENIIHSSIIH